MGCCRQECTCAAVITGVIAGVILGVLYSFGLIATGIIFWALLAIGVAEVFLAPIYARDNSDGCARMCFCSNRRLLTVAAVGTIISAVVGLIVSAVASATVIAIVLGIAVFFAVLLIVTLICLAKCICNG